MTERRPSSTIVQPLAGTLVVDASRMLPGAVLARMLVDLGARVIKIEEPNTGDPMRSVPPLVHGVGAGFCAFYRGAESIGVDLRDTKGAANLVKLARAADVLVESFRPGTLEAWGAGRTLLTEANPTLVGCSLSSFGVEGEHALEVGHDLNFAALSGLLTFLPGHEVPRVQIADVTSGILACNAILAALLRRVKTGTGAWIDQPIVAAPMPLLTWALADAAAGGGGLVQSLLGGACPAYRLYTCGDGKRIALGALEPKFWTAFVEAIGLPDLAGAGLDMGPAGEAAARSIQETLAAGPRDEWLSLLAEHNLPVSPVHDLEEALGDPRLRASGWFEETPVPGGDRLPMTAPFLPSVSATPDRPAPRLGEHSDSLAREFDLD